MNNQTNTYVVTFSPVNDVERIAAQASSNINSLAVGDGIMHSFRGAATLGQQPNVATPIATTAGAPSAGLASSLAASGSMWEAVTAPAGQGSVTSGTAIQGTSGSDWQPVGLANLGNLTAF